MSSLPSSTHSGICRDVHWPFRLHDVFNVPFLGFRRNLRNYQVANKSLIIKPSFELITRITRKCTLCANVKIAISISGSTVNLTVARVG